MQHVGVVREAIGFGWIDDLDRASIRRPRPGRASIAATDPRSTGRAMR